MPGTHAAVSSALSGEELAERAGDSMTGQNDVADAVRRLRGRIEKAMLERANVRCGRQDVITNDRKYGYCLSAKIVVRDGYEGPSDVDVGHGEDLGDRQQWILAELQASRVPAYLVHNGDDLTAALSHQVTTGRGPARRVGAPARIPTR